MRLLSSEIIVLLVLLSDAGNKARENCFMMPFAWVKFFTAVVVVKLIKFSPAPLPHFTLMIMITQITINFLVAD